MKTWLKKAIAKYKNQLSTEKVKKNIDFVKKFNFITRASNYMDPSINRLDDSKIFQKDNVPMKVMRVNRKPFFEVINGSFTMHKIWSFP